MSRFKPLLLIALAGAAPLSTASGTQLAVTAVVAKFASVALHGQPAALVVTDADIARGFVEIAEGGRIELRSNSREGMKLEFLNRAAGLVRGIEVTGLPGGAVLPGAARGVAKSTFAVGYRILLAPAARPGIYSWPVELVAAPL